MSGIDNTYQTQQLYSDALLGEIEEIKQEAQQSVSTALKMLAEIIAGGTQSQSGVQELPPPAASLLGNAMELTLKIGLIQDALDQLQKEVSKLEIAQKMNQSEQANEARIEQLKVQMEEAQEAIDKQKEAEKKGNLFQAIGDWVNAAITLISAAITIATAIGYALAGNVAGAAGLMVAGVALVAAAGVQITLAIDSTITAAGGEGFLSDQQRKDMQTAASVLSYVAMGAALISGLGMLVKGMSVAAAEAGKAIAQETGKEATKAAVNQAVREGAKAAARELSGLAAKEGLSAGAQAAKTALIEAMKTFIKYATTIALTEGIARGAASISQGAASLHVQDLNEAAADARREADEAEARAKALEAAIAMLQAIIQQLQEQLEDLIDMAMESLSVIFNIIDDSQDTMTKLHQMQTA